MKEFQKFLQLIKIPLGIIAIIWFVEILENLYQLPFTKYGIYPRSIDGLKGVIFAPMIHGDWGHLLSNSAPILVLGTIMSYFYRKVALMSVILIWIITGFGVWVFARPSYHIGASGVVYGLVSFVFWSGIFRRDSKNIIIALVVLILYSGYAQGLVAKEGVSHESHFIGGVVGILIAFLFKDIKTGLEEVYVPLEKEPVVRFFPENTFESTIVEKRLSKYFDNHQRKEKWMRMQKERMDQENLNL